MSAADRVYSSTVALCVLVGFVFWWTGVHMAGGYWALTLAGTAAGAYVLSLALFDDGSAA